MLTYSELSWFDDLLVDVLIDRIHYWSTVRKMREYKPVRNIPLEKVMNILQTRLIKPDNPAMSKAVEEFTTIASVQSFLGRFPLPSLRAEFHRHVRRYLSIYLPECGFSIDVTGRYLSKEGGQPEACVVSRKHYIEGEEIRYLCGVLSELSEEDERILNNGRDFSIINSSRIGANCLMLGPTRFINHDCNANARFVSANKHMRVQALRAIVPGEEITVTYAENYFGVKNRECLCYTCEVLQRNGFDSQQATEVESECDEEENFNSDENATLTNESDSNDGPGMINLASYEVKASPSMSLPVLADLNLDSGDDSRSPSPSVENSALSLKFRQRFSSGQFLSTQSAIEMSPSTQCSSEEPPSLAEEIRNEASPPSTRVLRSASRLSHNSKNTTTSQHEKSLAAKRAKNSPKTQVLRTLRSVSKTNSPKPIYSTNLVTDYVVLHSRYSLPICGEARNCTNCKIPFKATQEKPKRVLCERCYRHALLYSNYWPSTQIRDEDDDPVEIFEKKPAPALSTRTHPRSRSGVQSAERSSPSQPSSKRVFSEAFLRRYRPELFEKKDVKKQASINNGVKGTESIPDESIVNVKRGRGRPKGIRIISDESCVDIKRGRGRPKGTTKSTIANKPLSEREENASRRSLRLQAKEQSIDADSIVSSLSVQNADLVSAESLDVGIALHKPQRIKKKPLRLQEMVAS